MVHNIVNRPLHKPKAMPQMYASLRGENARWAFWSEATQSLAKLRHKVIIYITFALSVNPCPSALNDKHSFLVKHKFLIINHALRWMLNIFVTWLSCSTHHYLQIISIPSVGLESYGRLLMQCAVFTGIPQQYLQYGFRRAINRYILHRGALASFTHAICIE